MKKLLTPFLCWWVGLAQRHAHAVVFLLFIMVVLSGVYIYKNFSIDSDLDKFIRPSIQNQWHANNEDYRNNFPSYHRNAVVVVSGSSAEETFFSAERLYHALKDSQQFDDVFAPVFDPFIMDRIFYNIPTEGVKRISEAVSASIPQLAPIYQQPSIIRLLDYLQAQYLQASDMEVFLPDVEAQLGAFNQSLSLLLEGENEPVYLVPKLAPLDDGSQHYQLISVKRAPQFTEELPNKAIIDDLRSIIAATDIDASVDVRITGEIAMMNDEISESIGGFKLAGQISVILILVILWLGIRSKRLIAGIFLMLIMGVLFSVVFTLLVFGRFNTLSLVFVVMLFGLGIDFAVHYSLRVMEAMRQGETIKRAGVISARDMGVALGLCALTTVIAFLSFLPTEYLGLAELGVISAFGMVASYVLSLTFIPAWFVVTKITPIEKKAKVIKPLPLKNFDYPARPILFGSLVLLLVTVWYIHDMRFNYNLLSMRNQSSEAIVSLRELQDNHLVNTYAVATVPDKGTDLEALKKRLLELPTVAAVQLPEENLPLFQEAKHQYLDAVNQQLLKLGEPSENVSLDKDATRQQIQNFIQVLDDHSEVFVDEDLELVEALRANLVDLLQHEETWPVLQKEVATGITDDVQQLKVWFSAQPFGLDDLPEDIHKRLVSNDGRSLVQIIPAVDMTITSENRKFIESLMDNGVKIAGVAVHEWGVGQVVVRAFTTATILSITLIFLVIAFTFKNIRPAIMIIYPMVLVVTTTLAIGKMLGMSLNMANILVVPLVFGLGVDTGIHVVHRYHLSYDWRDTFFSSTGRAVLLSAVTTIGTFIAIGFSQHQGAASIGILLSIALSLLLIITFVVLPALLMLFDPKDESADKEEAF